MSEHCLYPGCKEPTYSAAFHEIPLCREHFDLSQWISYILYKKDVIMRKPMRKAKLERINLKDTTSLPLE